MRIFSKIVSAGLPNTSPPPEQEKPIVVNGPLSEIYTQALNQIYAVDDPVTGESKMGAPSTESQANDSHLAKQLIGALSENSIEYTTEVPKTYVWATRLDLVTPSSMDDLVANVDEFENDKEAVRYVMVNDANADGGVRELAIGEHMTKSRMIDSMEAFVVSKGGTVVNSPVDIFKK